MRRTPFKPRKSRMSRGTAELHRSGNFGSTLKRAKREAGSKRALGQECDKQTSLAVRWQTPYCVLCKESRWYLLTCGHMFKRGVQSVRYDYLPGGNCHTLCRECNRRDNEDHNRYVFWFVKTYGPDAFAALRDRACSEVRRWEPDELRQMTEERKARVEELKQERSLEAA